MNFCVISHRNDLIFIRCAEHHPYKRIYSSAISSTSPFLVSCSRIPS